MRSSSFRAAAPLHASTGGQFAHGGNFGGRYGRSFAGQHGWDNYFRSGWGGRGWGWGWGWGGYWPWYAGWGLGWGYPFDYGYSYYYPNVGDYYYSYPQTGYGDYYYSYPQTSYGDTGMVMAPDAATPRQSADSSLPATTTSDGQQGATEATEFYSEARAAFLQGDYQNALRLAGHAGLDAPQNPKVHELISLALFASGNYRAAASEAHAAMALGTIADWKDLYAYYNDVAKYTTQLRALEKAAIADPNSAAEHFLLGYQYLMTGARENAKAEFAQAVKLTPDDKLANHYLQELQSNVPLTPPEMASRPQGQSL